MLDTEWKLDCVPSVKTICTLLADFADKYFGDYVAYIGYINIQRKLLKKLLT